MSSTTPASNETKNVQLTVLILYNGTYPVNQEPDPVLEIAELVLLGILFLISLCGNTFLLVTIVSSYTLRGEIFNILLANCCAIFLIETTVNMSIALLCIATDTWLIGHIGCAISSFTIQIVTMEITFGLSVMSLQSMILMRNPYEFQSFWTLKKQAVAIATFWLAGIVLCLPLILESIQSHVLLPRYGCAFTGYDGFIFMLFVTVWCYGVMIIIGIGCLINIAVHQYKEYREQARKHGLNYSDVFIPGGLWTEWINVKLVAWLTLFYLILELPYIIMHQVTGLKYEAYTSESSTKHETVFTWFRYLYSCSFACVVFKVRKDIRYKFRNLWPCCRSNVVRDQSPIPTIKPDTKKKERKDSIPPISLSTPVLYISPEGLCLRQLAPPAKSFLNYTQNDKMKKEPNFISYLCDVEPVSVTEDYSGNLEDSFSTISRRSSKESEISLTELNNSSSSKNISQEVPLKDLDPTISVISPIPKPSPDEKLSPKTLQPSPKKKVRFADTLTFFRALTPEVETPTPGWVTTSFLNPQKTQSGIRSRHSKIPMRVQSVSSNAWKVEMNRTYNVNKSPISHQGNHMPKAGFRNNSDNKTNNEENPLQWRINQ